MKRVIRDTSRSSGQSGLTLVELLVAMAIGLILLTGIFQVFLGSNSIYRTQDSLSRLQENGRFAIELLTQKVHLAGYPRISVTGNAYTGTAINGTNGAGTASDTLTIDFLNPAGAGLSPPYTFAVDAVNSELDMTDTTGTLPLIDGIESMQILYGEDTGTDSQVDVYRTAAAVADWDRVVAVRIGLLLHTLEEVPKGDLDTGTYNVNGTVVDPVDDRRLRRVFTTTISLRNRSQ